MRLLFILFFIFFLVGCTSIPSRGKWNFQYDRYEEIRCLNFKNKVHEYMLITLILPFDERRLDEVEKVVLFNSKGKELEVFTFSRVTSERVYYQVDNKFSRKHMESFDRRENRIDLLYYFDDLKVVTSKLYAKIYFHDGKKGQMDILEAKNNLKKTPIELFSYKELEDNLIVEIPGDTPRAYPLFLIYEYRIGDNLFFDKYMIKRNSSSFNLKRKNNINYEAIQVIREDGSYSENKIETYKECPKN